MDDPLPLKFVLKVTNPLSKNHNIDHCLLIAPEPCELAKKVQLALIGSRPRAFQRAIDEPCTLPLSPPKGGTKRDFAIFPVKFNFCRKKSAAKFLRVETSSGKVVATSFLYLTVHRSIAGDVPIYQKFELKVTHPFKKRRFRQISLNSAAAVRARKKCSISTNRKSTTHFPSSTPKSPKDGSKRRFLHLAMLFTS